MLERITNDRVKVIVCKFNEGGVSHLRPAHADDAVDTAVGVVEEGHGDGVLAGRQPVALGGRVDLEDMSSGAEDGLLPADTQRDRHTLTLAQHSIFTR